MRLLLDELPAAVDGISRVVELLRAFGAVDLLPTPLLMLSRVRILTGNPMEARTCLEEAMTLVESIGGQLAVGEYFESEGICYSPRSPRSLVTGPHAWSTRLQHCVAGVEATTTLLDAAHGAPSGCWL